MKGTCAKCGTHLDTEKGSILIIAPTYFKRAFLEFILCRPHFLESDKMTASQFRKWVHKKESSK